MTRVLLILLIGFVPLAQAESDLLPCPDDEPTSVWNDCMGIFMLSNEKGLYNGQWKDGEPYGQGFFTYEDGGTYIGDWKDGKRHGQGTVIFPDGEGYEGEWTDDKPHGQGTYTWPDGDKYIGEYKDGKRHGQGTLTLHPL